MRREWKWTEKQLDKLKKVVGILDELAEYKPLTLRQIYYQMVGKGFIENKVSEYGMLSNLLKWARIDGYVSWEDMEDRTRGFFNGTGFENKDEFVRRQMKYFLSGYKRNCLKSQQNYIEIWFEKDALSTIFKRVALPYCVSCVVCKGFSSVSFLNNLRRRLTSQNDKVFKILYFGDFDPSGVEMLNAMKTTLEDELGIVGIEFKRISLLLNDIHKYQLPHDPSALKHTDTRARKHVEIYGELAVELDALSPAVLEQKITDAIESEIDIDLFNKEVEIHNTEIESLDLLKNRIVEFIEK